MSTSEQIGEEVREVLQVNTVETASRVMKGRKFGTTALALIAFFEALLPLPIITDPFLVAAILLDRFRAKQLVIITTVASVIGGVVAYFMAVYFFDFLLRVLSPSLQEQFTALLNDKNSNTFILTLLGAVTPVPYTLVAWLVAVIKGSLSVFIIASIIGRGFRYGIVGYSTYRFGQAAVVHAKKYIGVISIALILLGCLYFVLTL